MSSSVLNLWLLRAVGSYRDGTTYRDGVALGPHRFVDETAMDDSKTRVAPAERAMSTRIDHVYERLLVEQSRALIARSRRLLSRKELSDPYYLLAKNLRCYDDPSLARSPACQRLRDLNVSAQKRHSRSR